MIILFIPFILNANTVISGRINYACNEHDSNTPLYLFCNTSLPINSRVEDLISRLTLEEKVGQLSNGASEVLRLGLPAYQWWSESLHGIATNGPGVNFDGPIFKATMFPQVILSTASFNASLWYRTAQAIAIEARAMYNVGQASLTFWAPNINIFRDPRWGRGQETPGEDPLVASQFAVAFVRGFQGEDGIENGEENNKGSRSRRKLRMQGVNSAQMEPSRLMLSACCKHFTAYDLESWEGYARYTFNAVMRLGLFDGDPKQRQYGHLGPDHVCTDEHQQLTLEGARQGIVLLKNFGNALPLSKTRINSLAVIGPNADAVNTMLGDYTGIPCNPITPVLGLQNYIANISFSMGCENVACYSDDRISEAIDIVAKADAVVVVVGLDSSQEREDHDRVNLSLPGEQQKLVSEVAHASKGPVVLVLMCGGPVDVSFAKGDPRISSILWVGYPGEAGGQALAEVIFGDYNPGGRLPMTWYPQEFISVPMTDMNMRPNSSSGYPGRTYRFYTGETVFQFGDGLSYSNYSYRFEPATKEIVLPVVTPSYRELLPYHIDINEDILCEKLKFTINIFVRNHGLMDGSHVFLLFSSYGGIYRGAPQKQLIGFKRVHVLAGKASNVSFIISPCDHLSIMTEHGRRVLAFGSHALMIGDTQLPISLTTNFVSIK